MSKTYILVDLSSLSRCVTYCLGVVIARSLITQKSAAAKNRGCSRLKIYIYNVEVLRLHISDNLKVVKTPPYSIRKKKQEQKKNEYINSVHMPSLFCNDIRLQIEFTYTTQSY